MCKNLIEDGDFVAAAIPCNLIVALIFAENPGMSF
jgi:hypothetical protein